MAAGGVFDFGSDLDPDGVRDAVLGAINRLPSERHLELLHAIDRGDVSIEDDHLDMVAITTGELTIIVDRSELVRLGAAMAAFSAGSVFLRPSGSWSRWLSTECRARGGPGWTPRRRPAQPGFSLAWRFQPSAQ